MIDPEKLFSAFELPKSDEPLIADLQKTQAFKLGMFKKIIWNQTNMEERMDKFLKLMPEIAETIDRNDDAGEFVTHTRAWTYLKDFDPNSEQGKEAARLFSDDYTKTACELALSFWEEREHYEKCAHIKNVHNLLKNSLAR
jgi:hypothetical protein